MDRSTLEKLAVRIVDSASADSLTDATVKVAVDRSLTPEAACSLTQMVNTLATLRHFEKSASREDSFPLAEPNDVLQGIIKHSKGRYEVKTSSATSDFDVPYAQAKTASRADDLDEALELVREKVAATTYPHYVRQTKEFVKESKRRGELSIMQNTKTELTRAYLDRREKMIQHFASPAHQSKFAAFVEDVVGLHGDEVKGFLNSVSSQLPRTVRESVRIDNVSPKHSALRIVDTTDPVYDSVAEVVKLASAYDRVCALIEKMTDNG